MVNKANQTKLIASYFGASFGLLQIVDICIDRFDLPVSIINYLLFAIAIGFVGILFYSYLPFLSQTKKSSNKGKKSLLSVAAILLIFILSISNIFLFRESNLSDIREEAYTTGFKKIDDFIQKEDYISAYNIAKDYYDELPNDSLIFNKLNQTSIETDIRSNPSEAKVYFKEIDSDEWIYIGDTPLVTRLPGISSSARGYINFKITKDGYLDNTLLTTVGFIKGLSLRKEMNFYELTPLSEAKSNMVRIPGGNTRLFVSELGDLNIVDLKPYWIDKFEVTNAEYQKFVDEGGYKKSIYWDKIIGEDGKTIDWEAAMELFVDKSGLSGPSTWSNGTYQSNQENYPVTGVSWYEARAYAKWVGKTLPTIYHWYKAAMFWGESTVISPRSNFSGMPSEVGKYNVLSSYGCYDMAGNAREWGSNPHKNGNRSVMGGGFDDETYFFTDNFSQHPTNRYKTNGFRCVIIPDDETNLVSADTLIQSFTRDFYSFQPISDEVFNIYNGMFKYDKSPLNIKVMSDSIDNGEVWYKKVVEIDAAYGQVRLPLNIFIPKNETPPFKTVVFVPGSGSITNRNSQYLNANRMSFLLRSGYALIWPIYMGTYERGYPEFPNYVENDSKIYADQMIMMVKDYSRAIDYVEEQDEFLNEVYYYGISWGGMLGPLFLANEDRIKKAVWQVAGLGVRKTRPEANPLTFLSRIDKPVLMLNGIYDQYFPFETSQKPMYDLLSLQEPMKKMITYESAHSPPGSQTSKEILKWFK
tara:strand:+ start:488 stop:2749 length:2262 start_codon:yes stop_codon:yes gene_type:complete